MKFIRLLFLRAIRPWMELAFERGFSEASDGFNYEYGARKKDVLDCFGRWERGGFKNKAAWLEI